MRIKRVALAPVLLLLLMFAVIPNLNAENYYVVTASSLNIRKSASPTSMIVGRLAKGDTIGITYIDGEWAECTDGYVSAEYIEEISVVSSPDAGLSASPSPDTKLLWIIVALIVLMWANSKFIRRTEIDSDLGELPSRNGGTGAVINGFAAISIAIALFAYLWQYGPDSLWFLFPSRVGGWGFSILNCIGLFYFTLNYLVGVYLLLRDIAYSVSEEIPVEKSIRVGLPLWGCGLFVCLLLYWLSPGNIIWGLAVVAVLQLGMVGYLIKATAHFGSLASGVFLAVCYLLCTSALVLLLSTVVAIIVCVALLGVVAFIALKMFSEIGGGAAASSHTEAGGRKTRYEVNDDGIVRNLTDLGGGEYQDDNGTIWVDDGIAGGIKKKYQ